MLAPTAPRHHLESVVAERCRHERDDQVATTRTYYETERLLRREYHGRFLIELLQNARDAWLSSPCREEELSVVVARLTAGPTLLVANSGQPLEVRTILMSLGEVGQSTKPKGEAIGHKGIGFKSVLELTRRPEVYSRARGEEAFQTRVRFDPEAALAHIRAASPDWDRWVKELSVDGAGPSPVPALRFPSWCDEVPADVPGDDPAIQTVIRLPFVGEGLGFAGIDAAGFVAKVRKAFGEITEEMFLLLGCFAELRLEDELAGTSITFRRHEIDRSTLGDVTRREVAILRNGAEAARFLTYERSLQGWKHLEGDLCVALKWIAGPPGRLTVDERLPPKGPPFHLFFPTEIASHLPLLLHAYFEVGASREQFAADEAERNAELLDGLRALAVDAFRDLGALAQARRVDPTLLPDLFGRTAGDGPTVERAGEFRDKLLAALDDIAWVPCLVGPGEGERFAPPSALFVNPQKPLRELAPEAFPPTYLEARVGRLYPAAAVGADGLRFLNGRPCCAHAGDAKVLGDLLRPGELSIWPTAPDIGFRALLRLLKALSDPESDAVEDALAALPGDDRGRVIPVLDLDGGRRTIALPESEGRSRRKDVAIFARLKRSAAGEAPPPAFLDIAFVADELLDAELLSGPAYRIGIREFNTEGVLDRLARFVALEPPETVTVSPEHLRQLLVFVWRLLLRQTESEYSVKATLSKFERTFAPGEPFFCKPQRARSDAAQAAKQRRERTLSCLRVPTRAGGFRPAGALVFGADWADWLARTPGIPADVARAAAYRDLELLAPDDSCFLASLDDCRKLLAQQPGDVAWRAPSTDGDNGAQAAPDERDEHIRLLHAFFLGLGVWEIPPLVAEVDYERRADAARDPFKDRTGRSAHFKRLAAENPFNLGERTHAAIHVGEDYDFVWPFPFAGRGSTPALVEDATIRSLVRGSELYGRYTRIVRFCPECGRHKLTYYDDGDDADSLLAHRLRHEAWVPVTVDARRADRARPADCFREQKLPREDRFHQSHLRFVPLVARELDQRLADLCRILSIETSDRAQMVALLRRLRQQCEAGRLPVDPRRDHGARQPFIALHRELYERLAEVVADDAELRAEADSAGVLCDIGGKLEWRPPREARFDNGEFTSWRRPFQGRVPFVVLERGKEKIARRLGVEAFEVEFDATHGDVEVDVTDAVRPLLRDRIAGYLALLVYYRSGGPLLQLGSTEFGERARRLDALRVIRTSSLEVRVSPKGMDLKAAVSDREVYLDRTQPGRPVLFVNAPETEIDRVLRPRLAAALCALVENGAIHDTFALYLQQDDDEYVESFLQERGITTQELDEVRRSADLADRETRESETRWWRAALALLGFPDEPSPTRDALLRRLAAPPERHTRALVNAVAACDGGSAARRDATPDGLNGQLELAGHSLAELDRLLREQGDEGLSLGTASRWLQAFCHEHGPAVAYLLTVSGAADTEAKRKAQALHAPEPLRLRAQPSAAEWLAPVLALLDEAACVADPELLAGARARQHLADIAGLSLEDLEAGAKALYSDEERRKQLREAALAWRRELLPLLVAGRCVSTDPDYRIREVRDELDGALPHDVATPCELATVLASLPGFAAGLLDALRGALPAGADTRRPNATALATTARAQLADPAFLDRVREVLARAPRKRVDELRRRMKQLQDRAMAPRASTAISAAPPKAPSTQEKKKVHVGKVRDTQQRKNRLGADAEAWALASVVDALLRLPTDDRRAAIAALRTAVKDEYEGEAADRIVKNADDALAAADSDELVDALCSFLHLSEVSDSFGCDVLGYLPAYAGEPSRPLFLEVKSDTDRSFHASVNEWTQAERIGADFAFLVILRGKDAFPAQMELLPDPGELLRTKRLSLEVGSWLVQYLSVVPAVEAQD